MSGIKGIVILTRFNYIEMTYGREKLKDFLDKIDVQGKESLIQPIVISKDYPEKYLKAIDELMLKKFFDNKESVFLELGCWNARRLMPRYFQIYIDERNPKSFLLQMERMRYILIGLGEMHVSEIDTNSYWVRINYGQAYLESVRLSELGFLEEGCRLCGANNLQSTIQRRNDISVEYQINWEN